MGGAGDGVFVDALGGGEEAGDEVAVVAGGGGDDGEIGQRGQGLHVGPEGGDVGFGGEDAEKVAGLIGGFWRAAEGIAEGLGDGDLGTGPGREVEGVEIGLAVDGEGAAAGLKGDLVGGEAEAFEEHEGGGEGGVAAKVDFDGGGEPTQVVAAGLLDEEGGFGEVILGGDLLEDFVGQPAFEGTDGGGVAAEELRGERVHLVEG